RETAGFGEEVLIKPRGQPCLVYFRGWYAGAHNQDPFRTKTQSDVIECDEALDQQTGSREQYHGKGDFGDDESIAYAPCVPANHRLSTTNCRTMRARLAPTAARIAISRVRAVDFASSRFAMLAHAISSSTPTAPSNSSSVVRTLVTISSRMRVTATAFSLLLS